MSREEFDHRQGFLPAICGKRKNAALSLLRKRHGKIILPDSLGIYGPIWLLKDFRESKFRTAAIRPKVLKEQEQWP